MGKGRAPCCDKDKVKRGPWSPEEDLKLINFIQKHGHENWRALPKQAGLMRCGKSCRLRWINYLRLDVKRGNFTKEEEETIIRLHEALGNKWSKIASHLPGRTDNEIKNVWNTHLKKRLAAKNVNFPKKDEPKKSPTTPSSSSSCSSITTVSSSCGKINSEAFSKAVSDKAKDFKTELSNHSNSTYEEPKDLSSSSISSNNSNVTNSSHQVDIVLNPEKQSEEVNKPELSDTAFDIPLESDLDFWNMLDSLGSFQYGGIQSNEVIEGYSKEAENNKWLRYLENELGLEVTKNENHNNLSKNAAEPEADLGMGHYHILPSSENSYAI